LKDIGFFSLLGIEQAVSEAAAEKFGLDAAKRKRLAVNPTE
jgi:hypothetical protein